MSRPPARHTVLALAVVLVAGMPAAATTEPAAVDLPVDAGARPVVPAEAAAADAAALAGSGFTVIAAPGTAEASQEAEDGSSGASTGSSVVEVAPGSADAAPLAVADAGGDLDGDGLADVLAYVTAEDPPADLVALSGVDGRQIWRTPTDAASYTVALETDVTGDGIDDLMTFAYDGDGGMGGCDDCPPSTEYHYRGTESWTVVSGDDGQALWSAVHPYSYMDVGDDPDVEGVHRWEARQDTRLLAVHDGALLTSTTDHRVDIVEERTGTPVGVGHVEGRRTVEGATSIGRLDALTGAVRASHVLDRPAEHVWAPAVGDFTGDGTTDLGVDAWSRLPDSWSCIEAPVAGRVCSDPQDRVYATDIVIVDGAAMAAAWTMQSDDLGVNARSVGDVDGDGAADLALTDGLGFSADRPALRVVAGPTGAAIWSRADGDLRGTGTIGDVPALLVQVDTDGDTFLRLDARTGAELLRTTHDRPDGANSMRTVSTRDADVDGDGMTDVWMDVTWSRSDGEDEEVLAAHRFVESGATGARLFDLWPNDGAGFAMPIDDIDGEGGQDVAELDLDDETVTYRSGQDGRLLWGTTRSHLVRPAGDMDGRPGAEFVAADGCAVRSLTGAQGTPRWTTDLCEAE